MQQAIESKLLTRSRPYVLLFTPTPSKILPRLLKLVWEEIIL